MSVSFHGPARPGPEGKRRGGAGGRRGGGKKPRRRGERPPPLGGRRSPERQRLPFGVARGKKPRLGSWMVTALCHRPGRYSRMGPPTSTGGRPAGRAGPTRWPTERETARERTAQRLSLHLILQPLEFRTFRFCGARTAQRLRDREPGLLRGTRYRTVSKAAASRVAHLSSRGRWPGARRGSARGAGAPRREDPLLPRPRQQRRISTRAACCGSCTDQCADPAGRCAIGRSAMC